MLAMANFWDIGEFTLSNSPPYEKVLAMVDFFRGPIGARWAWVLVAALTSAGL